MRSTLLLSVFFSLIPLGLLWSDWPAPTRESRRMPLPTENRMDAKREKSKARKAWFKERHRAPDGVDWLAIERENGAAQFRKRKLPSPPATGAERWVERGSTNQAGRSHSAQRLTDGTLYVGSALGGLWKQPPGGEWAPLGDNLYGGVHWLGVTEQEGALPIILAGTDWGSIHRTTDDGQNWEVPSGLPAMSELRRMIVAPDERVYLITGSWETTGFTVRMIAEPAFKSSEIWAGRPPICGPPAIRTAYCICMATMAWSTAKMKGIPG